MRTVGVNAIAISRRLGAGQSAEVFAATCSGRPVVYKRYRRPADAPKLRWITELVEFGAYEKRVFDLAAWPTTVVMGEENVVGLLMDPLPPRGCAFDELERPYWTAMNGGLEYYQPPQRLGYLGLCVKGLLSLHSVGVTVNDVHEQNMMFWPRTTRRVFLDCDSMAGPWGGAQAVAPASFPPKFRGRSAVMELDLARMALVCLHVLQEDPVGTVVDTDWLCRFLPSSTIDFLRHQVAGEEENYEDSKERWSDIAETWCVFAKDGRMAVRTDRYSWARWTDEDEAAATAYSLRMLLFRTGRTDHPGAAAQPVAVAVAPAAPAPAGPPGKADDGSAPRLSRTALLKVLILLASVAAVLVYFLVLR